MVPKSLGVMSVILIAVISVCVKQTTAASHESNLNQETEAYTITDLDSNYWSYFGIESGDELGWSVSGAGDVNGDGRDDIIFGSPMYSGVTPEVEEEGAAFVFCGRSHGLTWTPDWMIGSGLQGSRFGAAVSGAGDVNGDGFDDVIIGAHDYKVKFDDPGTPKSGAAFVFHGSDSGLSSTPDWSVYAEVKEIDLGYAVSDAGDVNNDGYDDVIVGAPDYESQADQANEGKVYLYLGSPDGLSVDSAWTYESNQPGASLGFSLGAAGDVNGDGFDDVIVGAPHHDGDYNLVGAAYLFLGNPTGLNAEPDWEILGDQEDMELGSSVAGAGDVNGDEFDDVIIGVPHYSNGDEANIGAAFSFYGSDTGLSLIHEWVAYGPSGELAGSFYGFSVHSAGDVDGDGFSDVLVGARNFGVHGSDEVQPFEGAAYLYKGGLTGLNTGEDWTASGNKAEAYFGHSVGSAGDLNGDGFDDVIIGSPYYRSDQREKIGSAFVFYANGGPPNKYYVFIPLISFQYGE
jgi:hypothetical protein